MGTQQIDISATRGCRKRRGAFAIIKLSRVVKSSVTENGGGRPREFLLGGEVERLNAVRRKARKLAGFFSFRRMFSRSDDGILGGEWNIP